MRGLPQERRPTSGELSCSSVLKTVAQHWFRWRATNISRLFCSTILPCSKNNIILLLFCGTIGYPYIFNYGSSRENSTSSYDNSAFADPCAFFWTNLSCQLLYFPFCRPVTEATKPPQQLTTPNSSGDVNVTSLIAKLLTGYDKRLRPRFGGKDNDLCLIFIESVCLAWSHRY